MAMMSIFDAVMIALLLGWPGLFVGALVGGWAGRSHRVIHATWLALVGLLLCIVIRLAPW